MSNWSEVQFSVHQRPLSIERVCQARALIQDQLRTIVRNKSRFHWVFMLQSLVVIAIVAVVGQGAHALFDWKVDSFLRLVALCGATTFFLQKAYSGYQFGKAALADETHLKKLWYQLEEVGTSEHLQFAQEHLLSLDVMRYLNEVNEQGRRLLVGEAEALRHALAEPGPAGRRRYA